MAQVKTSNSPFWLFILVLTSLPLWAQASMSQTCWGSVLAGLDALSLMPTFATVDHPLSAPDSRLDYSARRLYEPSFAFQRGAYGVGMPQPAMLHLALPTYWDLEELGNGVGSADDVKAQLLLEQPGQFRTRIEHGEEKDKPKVLDHLLSSFKRENNAWQGLLHYIPWGELLFHGTYKVPTPPDGEPTTKSRKTEGGGFNIATQQYVPQPYETAAGPVTPFEPPPDPLFGIAPLGLVGHFLDRSTGLIYMHHRYFSPRLGHFLTPDFRAPDIYDPTTVTEPYAYANGNPVLFWDPNGCTYYRLRSRNSLFEDPRLSV